MEKIIVKKYPAVEGCYGERVAVNVSHTKVREFFDLVCLWRQDGWSENEYDYIVLYELPRGVSLEDDIFKTALGRLNVKVIE